MKNIKYLFIYSLMFLGPSILFAGNKISSQKSKIPLELLCKNLLKAAEDNNLKRIKKIITTGTKIYGRKWDRLYPNIADVNGMTLFMWFCYHPLTFDLFNKEQEDVQLLIGINSDEYEKATLIKYSEPYLQLLKKLIQSGADINQRNNKDETALEIIQNSKNKNPDFIKLLNEAQESNNKLFKEVIEAIKNNDKKSVINWLSKNPILVDANGNNALHVAAELNNAKMFNIICFIIPELFKAKNHDNQTPTDKNPLIIALLISTKRLNFIK